MVRNLCRQEGKKARLEIHGEDTQLDRSIASGIRERLTHLIRSVDHGIEAPGKRVQLGKSETATICLSAHHEGGLRDQIHSAQGRPVIQVRSEIIPVFFLDRVLGVGDRTAIDRDQCLAVVVEASGKKVGFVVDELVVKPFPTGRVVEALNSALSKAT